MCVRKLFIKCQIKHIKPFNEFYAKKNTFKNLLTFNNNNEKRGKKITTTSRWERDAFHVMRVENNQN